MFNLYKIQQDNDVKLYHYKAAKNTLRFIMGAYTTMLSEDEKSDMENSLKIWTALENEPKQEVIINKTNSLLMFIDKAALKNLNVTSEKDSVNLIFDTGANLSTASESTAEKLGMKIIPGDIKVGTITGEKASARIAICPIFKLGSIEIRNAIFLVLKDSQLFISKIDYQINGILGFPVIEALHEIEITQAGYFTVPKEESRNLYKSNLAIDGLTPLIFIDGRQFTFDTGATNTILYQSYYKENQKAIDSLYNLTKVDFAGAGGRKQFDGFVISIVLNIIGRKIALKDVQLLKNKIIEEESVYGNIGQDVIKQFSKMTLNFDQMFIKFE